MDQLGVAQQIGSGDGYMRPLGRAPIKKTLALTNVWLSNALLQGERYEVLLTTVQDSIQSSPFAGPTWPCFSEAKELHLACCKCKADGGHPIEVFPRQSLDDIESDDYLDIGMEMLDLLDLDDKGTDALMEAMSGGALLFGKRQGVVSRKMMKSDHDQCGAQVSIEVLDLCQYDALLQSKGEGGIWISLCSRKLREHSFSSIKERDMTKSMEEDYALCIGELVPRDFDPTPIPYVRNGNFEEDVSTDTFEARAPPGWNVLYDKTYRLDIDDPEVKAKSKMMAYRASRDFANPARIGRPGVPWGSCVHGTPAGPEWVRVHCGHLLAFDGNPIDELFLPFENKQGMRLLEELESEKHAGLYHVRSRNMDWGGFATKDGNYHLVLTRDGNVISQAVSGHKIGGRYVVRINAKFRHEAGRTMNDDQSVYYLGVRLDGASVRDPSSDEAFLSNKNGNFFGGNSRKHERRYTWTMAGTLNMRVGFLLKYVAESETININIAAGVPIELQNAWQGETNGIFLDSVGIELEKKNLDLAAELRSGAKQRTKNVCC